MRSFVIPKQSLYFLPVVNKYTFYHDNLHPWLWLHMSTSKQNVDLLTAKFDINDIKYMADKTHVNQF